MATRPSPIRLPRFAVGLTAAAAATALMWSAAAPAQAAPTYSSDTKPDPVPALSGYTDLWQPSGQNDLHGTVKNTAALQWNDRLTSWINQNATSKQKFRALQNAAYLASDGSGYDQSITIADGLGKNLGGLYAKGRINGDLPLTTALINSSNGTTGAFLGTGPAKATFSYPRPFLNADPSAAPVSGDEAACAPSAVNGSSVAPIRKGTKWADAAGSLKITRVPDATDTTHAFANADVDLSGSYGTKGLCTGGSYPSGHTTTAYQAGITLATLLPELAPQILARASEAGNNRIVLGVHYPLDIIGGRMNGEIALAARWGDKAFRTKVLEPARAELIGYLEKKCGKRLGRCIAADAPYRNNPYGGAALPGGSSQKVTDRASAVKVFTERLGYGFAPTRSTRQKASVPSTAANLLRSTYPLLTDAQRRSVLAQTEAKSGHPLDTTWTSRNGTAPGSWQRLNLAKAMSATVKVFSDGRVKVVSTGGLPKLIIVTR